MKCARCFVGAQSGQKFMLIDRLPDPPDYALICGIGAIPRFQAPLLNLLATY
jgi:hypothetical protein